MVCWSMTHTQMCGYFIHCYAAIFLHDGFNCCNGLWCHYSVCLTRPRRVCHRTNAVHNFLVHSYICCSDRHASPYWTFIRRWISMGFIPSLLKKQMTERCSSLVHVASGANIFTLLLRRRLRSCIVLLPVGHSSNHQYHCCPLTRQSSYVSNFHRTFKVFVWLSLVQGAAERTPLLEKRINSKPKKIRQMFFYFWKEHRMPFYINVFWTKLHSSGGLEYWYTDVVSLGSCPWRWESFQV